MNLKVKFVPYENIGNLKEILKDLQQNTILMIDAKLSVEEETNIIEETMRKISGKFSGIELSSLSLSDSVGQDNLFEKLKVRFFELLTKKQRGITVIGPARIIKRIEKNPDDLLLDMSG